MRYLFLFMMFPFLSFAQSEKASDVYGEAVRAYYAGDYTLAVTKYSEALRLKPNTIGYLYNRALTYRKLNQDSAAWGDFLLITTLEPKYADAWYQLGTIRMDQKQYDGAHDYLANAIRISPNDIKSLQQMGLLLYYRHKNDDAIQIFTRILAIDSVNEQAYFKRGLTFFNDSNFNEALADFSQAYALDPTNTLALEQRALCYLRMNDLDNACRDWNTLLEKHNPRAQTQISTYCTGK